MLRLLRVEVRSAIEDSVWSPPENQILCLLEQFERMTVFYIINIVYQLRQMRRSMGAGVVGG